MKKQPVNTLKIKFVQNTYKTEVPAPQKTKIISITKTNLMMIFGEINAVFSENYPNPHKCAVSLECSIITIKAGDM